MTMGSAGGDAGQALKKKNKRKQTGTSPAGKNGHASATGSKTKDEKISHAEVDGVDPSEGGSRRKEKKKHTLERKAKRQKNFHVIQEATALWEKLRQSSTPKDAKAELVSKILALCEDRVADLAASHTASRIIQSCVKHGTEDDRIIIQKQLLPRMVELSKNPYARFIMSKLIVTAPKSQLPVYFKAFKGKAPELLRHPAGTHVLDDLYSVAHVEQRRMMAAEFYGKEYALFDSGTLNNTKGAPESLSQLLSAVEGQKQLAIIRHVASTLTPVIEKGLVDNQLAHTLISEYMKAAPSSLVEDSVETLSGDALLHMIHTHEGAEAACMVLAYGSAKDRKKAIRAFKGHVLAAVLDEWGWLAIATALSVTDDTALLRKIIISELESEISQVVQDKHAHKVLLQLLHPYCSRYFSPEIIRIMKPPVKTISKRIEPEDDGGEATTIETQLGVSKKDDSVRRNEILEAGFWKAIFKTVSPSSSQYICKQYTSDIVVELCVGGENNFLEELSGIEDIDAIHKAVLESADTLLTDYYGSRALRRIILASNEKNGDSAKRFTELLWKNHVQGTCKKLKDSHAAKIVAAFIHCGCPDIASKAKKEIKVKDPVAWADKFTGKKH